MVRDNDWSSQKSHLPFFINHEFLIPMIFFVGMLITDKVRLYLSVMGIQVYDVGLINPLLFYAGISYIAVSLSFKSFLRWSKFRLSQKHPLINFTLNFSLFILPILTIILNPLLVLPLLIIHWFSHVRSPEEAEAKGRVSFASRKYTLLVMQIILCIAAYFVISYDIPTLQQLTLWEWLRN
jgi:hypothetical protein